MKIVIDIPKEVKEAFDKADDINFCFYDYNSMIGKAIQNGTPLDDVLDKIRAEIQENINYNKKMNYQGIVAGLLLTLDIIDKYKAESEDKG